MLTRRQLRELRPERLPLHVLELDYVQSVVLRGIHSRDDLVLKGGTCLRRLHGLHRFSEDLDFSLASPDVGEAEARAAVEAGASMMERAGMGVEVKGWRTRRTGFLCRLRYEGPLFTGDDLSRGTLEVEVSRVVPLREPAWTSIASEYVDAGTFLVQAMDPEEMAAEKLRSLRQRRKPRDLLDVWFLLGRGFRPDRELLAPQLEAWDLEGDDVTWSDDTELFDVDPVTGALSFTPGQEHVGDHQVTVSIEDDRGGEARMGFTLTVVNVNDAPVIVSVSPENGSRFKEGKRVVFEALATDEDGDELTYEWFDGKKSIGIGQIIKYEKMSPGKHKIFLRITDGNDTINNTINLKVIKKQESTTISIEWILISLLISAVYIKFRNR